MGDWLGELDEKERKEWDAFVEHARTETLVNMTKSSAVISIAPAGKPDIKFCVELGMSIMLSKPIVIIIAAGQEIPQKLRMIANDVIEADIDTEEGRKEVAKRLDKFIRSV